MFKYLKLALLIIVLAEEIKRARSNKVNAINLKIETSKLGATIHDNVLKARY